ncbi:hypothetical protein HJG60_008567 [Phyllostomus discolor]|uniref:Uncharacterized protein n=1 Tax=Phyllostomus discolor TaxID=89673 RepID=A0A833Z3N5_9CHIR|nr:hypothetical protein HJG60_008567 [Phyllostomus discolor]
MQPTIVIIWNSLSPTSFRGSWGTGTALFYACGVSRQLGDSKELSESRVFPPGRRGGGDAVSIAGVSKTSAPRRAQGRVLGTCLSSRRWCEPSCSRHDGPGGSGRCAADRWQPRVEALGRRSRIPPWMSHSRETEESWTMCVTRRWYRAIPGWNKGGVETTPTVPGSVVVRQTEMLTWRKCNISRAEEDICGNDRACNGETFPKENITEQSFLPPRLCGCWRCSVA